MQNNNKKIDCLLINPPDDFSRYPYLGLCFLAGSLKREGIEVRILDSAVLKYNTEDVVDYIVKVKPRIIGITTMSMTLKYCYNLVQNIKAIYKGGVIILGGAHINADPEIIRDIGVRYGMWGECEKVFDRFCRDILGGKNPSVEQGIIVNEHDISIQTPAYIDDLNMLSEPAYDLLPLKKYYSPNTNLRTISMITSRGCPYNCVYCSRLQQTKYRSMNLDKVIKQIESLVFEHRIQWIEFVDEIFTIQRARIKDLCNEIIKKKISFYWGCGTRTDKIDEELLKLMHEAGCRKIGFGIETGSEKIRFADNKRITNEQIVNAMNLCKKIKIKTVCSYILGHPQETIQEMKETIRFSKKLKSSFSYYFKMIPIPNSELFQQIVTSGKMPKDIWKKYMLGIEPYPVYYPETVNKKEMDRLYFVAWISRYLSFRTLVGNLLILLNPRYFIRSINAFIKLATGTKYKR